jgi:hypothetical protein
MLPRLFRLVIHLAEWVFGIPNGFGNDFQRFGHSLRSFVELEPGVNDATGLHWWGLAIA